MFKHICVPVDNSDYSNRAIELAVELGRTCGAKLTGVHVYAAQLHDYRFKQMEYTLPDEYKDEHELERQRKIHDSRIRRAPSSWASTARPSPSTASGSASASPRPWAARSRRSRSTIRTSTMRCSTGSSAC